MRHSGIQAVSKTSFSFPWGTAHYWGISQLSKATFRGITPAFEVNCGTCSVCMCCMMGTFIWCSRFGFVDFNSEEDAKAAKEAMEDGEIDGNKVTLDWAKPKGEGGFGGRGGGRGGFGGRGGGRGGRGGFGGRGRGGFGGKDNEGETSMSALDTAWHMHFILCRARVPCISPQVVIDHWGGEEDWQPCTHSFS